MSLNKEVIPVSVIFAAKEAGITIEQLCDVIDYLEEINQLPPINVTITGDEILRIVGRTEMRKVR